MEAHDFGFSKLSTRLWDPNNAKNYKLLDQNTSVQHQNSYENLKVLDGIYQSTEKKIDRLVKQKRLQAIQGKDKKKSLIVERMEAIEEKVGEMTHLNSEQEKARNVTSLESSVLDPRKQNQEKLKGNFSLIINERLPMQKQIEKYSNEPIAYYLHKKRNFFEKLRKRKQVTSDELVLNIKRNLNDLMTKEQHDLYILMNNIKIRRPEDEPDESKWRGFDPLKFLKDEGRKNKKAPPFLKANLQPKPRVSTFDFEAEPRLGIYLHSIDSMGHKRNSLQALQCPPRAILPLTQRHETPECLNETHDDVVGRDSRQKLGTNNSKEHLSYSSHSQLRSKYSQSVERRTRGLTRNDSQGLDKPYMSNERLRSEFREKKNREHQREVNRYHILYNKVNEGIRNEINKIRQPKGSPSASPESSARNSIVRQAKLLLSQPSIELISRSGSVDRLPPIRQRSSQPTETMLRKQSCPSHIQVKKQNKASFVNTDSDIMQKIRGIITKCNLEDTDGKNAISKLEALISEAKLRQDGFDTVFNTLQQLDNTEAKVLELLFFYKINDIEEFEKEKNEIVKEYKLKSLI